MITTIPKSVKLWGRGQLTIPKEVRHTLNLDETSHLAAFVVGPCLVLTPKRLLRASLAKDVERTMKAKGIGLGELLDTLKQERKRYNRETYGHR